MKPQKYSTLFFKSGAVLASLGLFACASQMYKVDLPPGTDPQPKLTETETRLNNSIIKQYDQLSPRHFSNAENALHDAREKSEKGKPAEDVLNDVGIAMGELQMVEQNGDKNSAVMSTVLSARMAAKAARADSTHPQEFNSADEDLQDLGKDLEEGDSRADSERISKLQGRYAKLELLAIKKNHLGKSLALIEKAEDNGAKSKAPQTYSDAKVQYDAADRAIEANRNSTQSYMPAVARSVKSAEKLDYVIGTINESKANETVAVRMYDQKEKLAQSEASLADADQISMLNQKIEKIKAEFRPNEAEVVRDGNKIVIRLKSMKFSTARSELKPGSLTTLQKVKEMITAVPVAGVVVEGHTDSVGNKAVNQELSQERAEAVKQYLVAEKTVPESKIEAKGMGYERPITTNKTKEGRATNRRVDVVIETTATM